jgi:REP element-mobilizing transposase RayT
MRGRQECLPSGFYLLINARPITVRGMAEHDIAYFVPWAEIDTHERRLPHWQQGQVAVFVTWRLADALAEEKLAAWHSERTKWLVHHPEPWNVATRLCYAELFGQRIDRWLDAGHGSCLLRDPLARVELIQVLQAFDGTRYRMHAWVVMPNHVHVLFSPIGTDPSARTVAAWKGVSARRIHLRCGGSGRLWQPESWDTLIRSPNHFASCLHYIAENPVSSRLSPDMYSLWMEAYTS